MAGATEFNKKETNMNIYVGNLSYEVTEEELQQEFKAFGEVTSVRVITDKYTGRSKGFAFAKCRQRLKVKPQLMDLTEKR